LTKRILYRLLRHYKTKDWVGLLPDAIKLLNAKPLARNGQVAPEQINSFYQDPLLRKARESAKVNFHEPNRQLEEQTEAKFNQQVPAINVGTYVFLDRKQKVFDKSFELQVRRVSKILFFGVKLTKVASCKILFCVVKI